MKTVIFPSYSFDELDKPNENTNYYYSIDTVVSLEIILPRKNVFRTRVKIVTCYDLPTLYNNHNRCHRACIDQTNAINLISFDILMI